MKYKYISWQTAKSRPGLSGQCSCGVKAEMLAVAETDSPFDSEDVVIRGRCLEHYKKGTQKKWLKDWRKKNCLFDLS